MRDLDRALTDISVIREQLAQGAEFQGYAPATLAATGLEEHVIAIVGRSATVARLWREPAGMLFIDGGHSDAAATADYEGWAPRISGGGALAIHDVFGDPADGGQAPYRVYLRALASGAFKEVRHTGSLRVLERIADGIG